MLYLSVYQIIKAHITSNTEIGKQLLASKKTKLLAKANDGIMDYYQESQYSAVHYDMKLVIKMIQATVAEKRTNQSFILLEGLCNNNKLENEEDKLSLRYMDELFQIEKSIGEIVAAIGLQYHLEPTSFADYNWEVFEEPVVEEKKAKILDEEGNEVDAPPAEPEAEGEAKVAKFNPAEFKWTVTNRRAKNLPQLFRDYKGVNCQCEERPSESFSQAQGEAVTKSLDDFCSRVIDDSEGRFIY